MHGQCSKPQVPGEANGANSGLLTSGKEREDVYRNLTTELANTVSTYCTDLSNNSLNFHVGHGLGAPCGCLPSFPHGAD